MNTTTLLTSMELVEAAGCTYRQLDYWAHKGVMPTTAESTAHGSGTRRLWPSWYVPRLMLLAEVQHTLGASAGAGGVPAHRLRQIFDAYESGRIDFDGFSLQWEVR